MAQWVELLALNRNARIRVKGYGPGGGNHYNQLSTDYGVWVNIDDPNTRSVLNHHSSIGQYLPIAWNGSSTPIAGTDFTNPSQSYRAVHLTLINKNARIRFKNTNPGTWEMTYADDNVIIVASGDPAYKEIASYNRKSLNRHSSIGHYVNTAPVLRALNRSAKARIWNSNQNSYETLSFTSNSNEFDLHNKRTCRDLNHHRSIGQYIVVDWD